MQPNALQTQMYYGRQPTMPSVVVLLSISQMAARPLSEDETKDLLEAIALFELMLENGLALSDSKSLAHTCKEPQIDHFE